MKRVCFDANVALAFALQDEPLHEKAKAVVRELAEQNVTLCAPPLFVYECDSILRLRVYKDALSEADAQTARSFVAALSVSIEHLPAIQDRAFEIARIYAQPRVYDATYAAFAEVNDIELLTVDKPFFEAVNGTNRPTAAKPLRFIRLLTNATSNL